MVRLYEVVIIAPSERDFESERIRIKSLGLVKNRFQRITKGFTAFRLALGEKASIYHLHDPELIFLGLFLKFFGKKVVYDAHEDLPKQVQTKEWIPAGLRSLVSLFAILLEKIASLAFDAVIGATPLIAQSFSQNKTVVLQNFPRLNEFEIGEETAYADRNPTVVYIGGISLIRGIKEMVQAMGIVTRSTKASLVLGGNFIPADLINKIKKMEGWERVEFVGWKSRGEIQILLKKARVGLVLLHPTENYLASYPVKLFEYMAAGIPVVASDFPLWRQIIKKTESGLLVDPLDPKAIAQAIRQLLENREEAEKMGRRGRKAIAETYNWEKEEPKLLKLYEDLLQ